MKDHIAGWRAQSAAQLMVAIVARLAGVDIRDVRKVSNWEVRRMLADILSEEALDAATDDPKEAHYWHADDRLFLDDPFKFGGQMVDMSLLGLDDENRLYCREADG